MPVPMECCATGAPSSLQRPAQDASVEWTWWRFDTMSATHLHAALGLRQAIFIVEQNVAYADIDGRDPKCMHLLGYGKGELVGYLRTLPRDLFQPGFYSFGRVIVRPEMRGSGLGRDLVRRGLAYLDQIRGSTPIKISSQLYLKDFYASFGFAAKGEPYLEDQIPHIAMVRR